MIFSGAKLALFLGDDLLVIRRDDKADIPYPDHLDLPGGGREGAETPEECALRETREEIGLVVSPSSLIWSTSYWRPHGLVWFFVAHLPADRALAVRFGEEGQGWQLMPVEAYCQHPKAIQPFVTQLRHYLMTRPAPPAPAGNWGPQ